MLKGMRSVLAVAVGDEVGTAHSNAGSLDGELVVFGGDDW